MSSEEHPVETVLKDSLIANFTESGMGQLPLEIFS